MTHHNALQINEAEIIVGFLSRGFHESWRLEGGFKQGRFKGVEVAESLYVAIEVWHKFATHGIG